LSHTFAQQHELYIEFLVTFPVYTLIINKISQWSIPNILKCEYNTKGIIGPCFLECNDSDFARNSLGLFYFILSKAGFFKLKKSIAIDLNRSSITRKVALKG